MKYTSIILFLLFSSQTVARDIARILTEREITFNNRLVLKLHLENNGAKLINKFSNVCSTFKATKGVIKEDFAGYRKSHGLTSGIGLNFYGNDSDSCLSAFEGWQHYQNFSWGACNMAKITSDGKYISNCEKWSNKESSFFGYLEVLTTKATDIINQKKIAKIEKDKNERLAKIEARKQSLAKNKQVTSEITKQQTDDCISELEDNYSIDKGMLTSLSESVGSAGVYLKADLIEEANKKLRSISIEKPLILTGNEFCKTIPEYKAKYDEINKGYSEINTQLKTYNTKIQAEIVKRRQASLAKKKKTELSARTTIQPSLKPRKIQSQSTSDMTHPYIKEGRLFCSSKAQFDEQITWLAQNIKEFVNGCGATQANIAVIVLDTNLFRGSAKVRGKNNKMFYYITMESLIYP